MLLLLSVREYFSVTMVFPFYLLLYANDSLKIELELMVGGRIWEIRLSGTTLLGLASLYSLGLSGGLHPVGI